MTRSIRFRLYLVFGVFAALILMVAVFEAVDTQDIGRTIDRLSGREINGIQSLTRIGRLTADVRAADGEAVLGDTDALRNQALGDARTRVDLFEREVGRYVALTAGEPETPLRQALALRAAAFVAAQGEFERQFADPGDGRPAEWYRAGGRLAYDQAQAAIEAVLAETDRRAAGDAAGAHAERRGFSLLADGMLGAALLLVLLAVIHVATSVIEPLSRLTAAMHRLGQGEWGVDVPSTDRPDEIGEMARAIQAFRRQGMAGERAAEALRALNADLERLAMIDPLTGVANRRHFYQRAAIEIDAARRRRVPLTCLMLDIDFFKAVNDRYGHAAGDQVLKQVAEIITIRIRPYDLLGRLGGEEFAVLLLDADLDTAMMVAERLRVTIAASPALHDGVPLPVTISIGVATLEDGDAAIDPLLDRADRALYQAKNAGRDRVVNSGPPKPAAIASGG